MFDRGDQIPDPHKLIYLNMYINSDYVPKGKVFCTRVSLKHILEKDEIGLYLIHKLTLITFAHQQIFISKNKDKRFLFVKYIDREFKTKPHVAVLEYDTNIKGYILVTMFLAKEKYFKNLKLLWGTTFSPSQ